MLKAAGVCLILLACTFLGFDKSQSLSKRLSGLKEFQRMCVLLRGEITYRKAALPEALNRTAKKLMPPFSGFLEETARRADAFEGGIFSEIFSQEAEKFFAGSFFTPEDMGELKQLGQCLGYMDIAMQESTIDLYLTELEQKILELSKEIPAKRKLYRSLGVLGGIFLSIALL